MKKTIPTIVMAMLCLSFSVRAQENKAIDVTSKGIQIGQKVPITSALEKYEGKLIILDFWATWCSPCVAMIPKMEALQAQFKDEIQILPVAYQTEKEVLPFLAKLQKGKPSILPQITGDKELHKLFPHVYLPHYVWIDYTGTVLAITGKEEITEQNIEKILSKSNADPGFKQKKDMKVAYNKTKPFLINGNGADGQDLLFHSVLTRYTEGLKGEYSFFKQDSITGSQRITFTNSTIQKLFKKAYGGLLNLNFTNSRVIIEVEDTTKLISNVKGQDYFEWLRNDNGFCYELIVPKYSAKNVFPFLVTDLTRLFPQYIITAEKRKVKCLVLVRTSKVDKLKSKSLETKANFGGQGCSIKNGYLNLLIGQLELIFMQDSKLPLINATDYRSRIDLEINSSLSDIESMNRELAKYDLKFIPEVRSTDMLIFRDNKSFTSQN